MNCGPKRAFTVIDASGQPLLVHNCYTFDSQNHPDHPQRPLITYGYQEDAILRSLKAIGQHNMVFPKTRRMGVTTLLTAALFWRWMFRPMQSFLLLSAKEDDVDSADDPSCIMWKLDNLYRCLPTWMRPPIDRTFLRFSNADNGSVFNGESTNKNPDRGGVRTAVLADEVAAMPNAANVYAAIEPLTNTIYLVSTPQGGSGLFYELYVKWKEEHPDWVVELHWTKHPVFAQGLYFTDEVLTGYSDVAWGGRKPRSPWYDHRCANTPSKKRIAQEYDIAFNESGGRKFEEELVQKLLRETVRPPVLKGDLESGAWQQRSNGRLKLWCELIRDRPPPADYVLGIDICEGLGGEMSSQSAISIIDRDTGQKVGEYAYNRIRPTEFARYCVALAKWFHGGKLIWGRQGPGRSFGQTVRDDCRYFNFYREASAEKDNPKATDKMGYSEQGASRKIMFDGYEDALYTGRFANRSEAAVLELRQFIYDKAGVVRHSKALATDNPEEGGELHGDLVVADALACRLLPERKIVPTEVLRVYPPDSAGGRLQEYLRQKEESAYY